MRPENLEQIQQSFTIQALQFESKSVNFSKEEYLQYTLSRLHLNQEDTVLEAAAGTCICGRSFSPFVHSVVCLDATAAMLKVGQEEAQKHHLNNMFFLKGYVAELPFLDNSFSLVFSRLAFHHFTNIHAAFAEMLRVLKPDGRLVLIDMEAAEESLRQTEDEIERLRDPSHVKNLSLSEMQQLFLHSGMTLELCEVRKMEQKLSNWMNLTGTESKVQEEIRLRMQKDLEGKEKTGFYPYQTEDDICFQQRWALLSGRKTN